ncbi:MAG: hypothetical protein OHK0029_13570 [Armatimonadaceae bacterium]
MKKWQHGTTILAVGLLLAIPVSPSRGQNGTVGTAEPLTLEQAIELALTDNREYTLARQERDRATGQRNEARAARNPTLGATAGYVRLSQGQVVDFGPVQVVGAYPNQANYTAQIALPIDVAGMLRTAESVSELQRVVAELDTMRVRNDLMLQVRVAFYDVLRAESLRVVAETAVKNAETRLADAEKAKTAGIVPRFDVIRAETGLADTEQQRIQAINRVRLAQSALNRVLGQPIANLRSVREPEPISVAGFDPEPGSPDPNANPLDDEYAALVAEALANRPEILAAEAGIKASERGITLARRSLAPTLGAQVGGQYNPNAGAFQLNRLATFGVTLTVPISDGGLARARKQQAEAEREAAVTTRRLAEDAITLEVQQAYLDLRTARERLRVAAAALEQGREAVRMARVRYQSGISAEGVSPLLEVSDAQTGQTQAESNYTNARYDVRIAQARLEKAVGRYAR